MAPGLAHDVTSSVRGRARRGSPRAPRGDRLADGAPGGPARQPDGNLLQVREGRGSFGSERPQIVTAWTGGLFRRPPGVPARFVGRREKTARTSRTRAPATINAFTEAPETVCPCGFPAPSSSVLFAPRPAPAAQISDARLALLFVADYRKMRSAAEVVVDDEPDLACRRPGHSKAYVREHPARTDVRALQPDSRSRRLAEQPHPVPEHDGDDLDDDLV